MNPPTKTAARQSYLLTEEEAMIASVALLEKFKKFWGAYRSSGENRREKRHWRRQVSTCVGALRGLEGSLS